MITGFDQAEAIVGTGDADLVALAGREPLLANGMRAARTISRAC